MFTPDLSLLNIGLMAAVAIILASYTIFLIKLKPTKENQYTSKGDFEKEKKPMMKPKSPNKQTKSTNTQKTISKKAKSAIEDQEIPEDAVERTRTKTHIQEQALKLTQEIQKRKKNKEVKKSFFLFGKKDFEGCTHEFGYLKSLPKNTPIPDECFGCPQILDCLMRSKSE